jgi:hypothetical protein
MKRRDFVKTVGAGSAAAGAAIGVSSFPAPAVAQGIKRFKMVTTEPKNHRHRRRTAGSAHHHDERRPARGEGRRRGRAGPGIRIVRCGLERQRRDEPLRVVLLAGQVARLQLPHRRPLRPHGDRARRLGHHGGGQELWDAVAAPFDIKCSCAPAPVSRWAAGSTGKSTRSTTTKASSFACRVLAARCCAVWAPL